VRFLIIQENGRHEKNRNFRESFCLERALNRLGHACTVWGLGHDNFSIPFDIVSKECDVVLSLENYDTGWHPSVTDFRGLKVFWSIDSHCSLDLHLRHCQKSQYDLLLNSTESYIERYRGLVPKAVWFPNAYPADLIAPIDGVQRECAIGFCGSSMTQRDALIDLISKTHPIKRDIFVIGEDMVRALSSYKIAFNCNIADDINYRTFEATAAGAMLLTNYTPNLERLFDIGKEVIAYRSVDEALAFIHYYSNNDDQRNAIAQAGMNRSMANHSYDKRAEQLISIIKAIS
jgi:hypothetical protein